MVEESVVLVDSDFGDSAVERGIVEEAELSFVDARHFDPERRLAVIRDASGLLVQYERIGAETIAASHRLRAIVPYGVGTDMVDLAAAGEAGVAVHPVTDYCVDEVADHTMGLVLACIRQIPQLSAAVASGDWPTTDRLADLRTLRGSRFGVVGYGSIGRAVAQRAAASGARVVAADPFVPQELMAEDGVQAVSLDEVFSCDIVSLHVPLNQHTRNLVSADRLRQLPEGAAFINVARGGLVDEHALLEEARTGRIRVGLDVLAKEPPDTHELVRLQNVVATPHVAWFSPSAVGELRRRAANLVVAALNDG